MNIIITLLLSIYFSEYNVVNRNKYCVFSKTELKITILFLNAYENNIFWTQYFSVHINIVNLLNNKCDIKINDIFIYIKQIKYNFISLNINQSKFE